MRLYKRGFLFIALLALTLPRAHATPIIVYRTNDGFILGTNAVNSAGALACKLHFVGDIAVLRAADLVGLADRKGNVVYNNDDDLWTAMTSDTNFTKVKQQVIENIEGGMSEMIRIAGAGRPPRTGKMPELKNNVVIVGFSGNHPQISFFAIEVSDSRAPRFTITDHKIDLQSGQLFSLANDEHAVRQIGDGQNMATGLLAVKSELNREAKTDARLGGKSYSPPFVIVHVLRDSITPVEGDLYFCHSQQMQSRWRKSVK
jgi:hypothetical protein